MLILRPPSNRSYFYFGKNNPVDKCYKLKFCFIISEPKFGEQSVNNCASTIVFLISMVQKKCIQHRLLKTKIRAFIEWYSPDTGLSSKEAVNVTQEMAAIHHLGLRYLYVEFGRSC